MTVFSKLYKDLQTAVKTTGPSGETEPDIKCVNCYRKEILTSFNDLQRADHICLRGQRYSFNTDDRHVAVYTHHAIVKSVQVVSQSSAMVGLIHFYTTPYDISMRIQETTELLDLNYHDIHIIRYRHKTHPPDTIIAKAEGLIKQNREAKYLVFFCNCEHFCNWCCVSNERSYQVDSFRNVMQEFSVGATNAGLKVLRVVCKLVLQSIDDLTKAAKTTLTTAPWVMIGVVTVLYFAYTIYRHYKLDKDLKAKKLCTTCCRRQKHDIWIQFVAYCGLQVGGLGLLTLIIAAGASTGTVAAALVVCCSITFACTAAVLRLRKKFCSPFQGRVVPVRSLKNVTIGDVISFNHWKILHDGVVCAVRIYPDTRDKNGEVTVIHYSLPSVFGRRTIVEETIKVDLGKHLILGHDYSGYNVHEPETVVERARQRIGETKFGVMSNRSCHFCHWAKVNEDLIDEDQAVHESTPVLRFLHEIDPNETISNLPSQYSNVDHTRGRKHATKTIKQSLARIRDDIKPGQIIEFKYRGFWHRAVSTRVCFDEHSPSEVSVTVVHYGKQRKVKEEAFSFNLNSQDVWIYNYHPLYRYRKDDVIRRARARIGEEKYNLLRHSSYHLAREIVVKEMNNAVTDLNVLKSGDVITFRYWSLWHDAVVTRVTCDDSKANTTGELSVIHYALKHTFAVRTVKEETMPVDLMKEVVYLKSYNGYVTYPPEYVVKRARSRLGEQRFSIDGNTSSDLAHWAKVVHHPAVIANVHTEDARTLGSKDDIYLLVPKAGKQFEEFQRFHVNAWSDLYPGIIIEYRYYGFWHQGILSYVDEKQKLIKVIHYGADHLFATRTVMEDTMKLDLLHDNVRVYRGHPKKCYKAGDVLINAQKRLGEKKWGSANTSWNFCKDCVLRQRSKKV